MSSNRKVLVVPGNGIGIEVTKAMLEVAKAANLPWNFDVRSTINSKTWMATGIGIPDNLMAALHNRSYNAILFGAMGDSKAPEGVVERLTLLRMRFELGLALNIRPLRLPPSVPSVLASGARIDVVVIRENTEGAYSGASGRIHVGSDDEVAVTTSVSTRRGVRKALEHGFKLAARRRGDLCLVHKANVIQDEGLLWRSEADAIAKRAPGVRARYMHADAAAMRLITHPTDFDVTVTDNLFGDLLTDLGAALAGGIGLAASSNINLDTGLALFEPIPGTAPDIVGTNRANPLVMIRCLAMCAAHLGEPEVGQSILEVVDNAATLENGTTDQYTRAVADALH